MLAMRMIVLPIELEEVAPGLPHTASAQGSRRAQARLYPSTLRRPGFDATESRQVQAGMGERRRCVNRANIAINLRCLGMRMQPHWRRKIENRSDRGVFACGLWICVLATAFCAMQAPAQEDPLNKVHVTPPPA